MNFAYPRILGFSRKKAVRDARCLLHLMTSRGIGETRLSAGEAALGRLPTCRSSPLFMAEGPQAELRNVTDRRML